MKNRPIYIQVSQFIVDNNYTYDQIKYATKEQVISAMNLTGDDVQQLKAWFDGIRRLLKKEWLERQRKRKIISNIKPAIVVLKNTLAEEGISLSTFKRIMRDGLDEWSGEN